MKPFAALRAMRRFQKAQLPFLETLEDLAVLTEIGFHQEQGTPISLKQLFLAEIGAAATVQRRLARLKRLGVVQQLRRDDDRRMAHLTINPALSPVVRRYAAVIRKHSR
jgi:hypothetical protein